MRYWIAALCALMACSQNNDEPLAPTRGANYEKTVPIEGVNHADTELAEWHAAGEPSMIYDESLTSQPVEIDEHLELWPNQIPILNMRRGINVDELGHVVEDIAFLTDRGWETAEAFDARLWEGIEKTPDAAVDKTLNCDTNRAQYPCDYGIGPGFGSGSVYNGMCAITDNRYHSMCFMADPWTEGFANAGFNAGMDFNLWWKQTHGLGGTQVKNQTFAWIHPQTYDPNNCPGWRHEPSYCCSQTTGQCGNFPNCANNEWPNTYPIHTDITFVKETLDQGDCGNNPEGYMGCTWHWMYPAIYSWNNQCPNSGNNGNHPYVKIAGAQVIFDMNRIYQQADSTRGSYSVTTAREFMSAHVFCHELGHALGLKHYDGVSSPWEPLSCMSTEWPEVADTKQYWNDWEECEVEGDCNFFGPTPVIPVHRPPNGSKEW